MNINLKMLGAGLGFGLVACATPPGAGAERPVIADDFEAYAVGGPPGGPWGVQQVNGTAVIDDSRAASGNRSVRIDVAGTGTVYLFNQGGPLFPAARDGLSGRMKVWLEQGPRTEIHWTIIEGRGVRRSDGHTGLVRFGGQLPMSNGSRLMSNYETPDGYSDPTAPMSDCWGHAGEADVMPEGRWVEVAWRIAPTGLTLSIDGRPISGPDVGATGQGCVHQPASYVWELPAMERVNIGWETYIPDGPRRLWIDDVEISD